MSRSYASDLRLDNPSGLKEAAIASAISAGGIVTIQFSRAIYSKRLLRQMDSLAQKHGDRLQIRFYEHFGAPFDASVLQELPSAQNLAIDCLKRVVNPRALDELAGLRMLKLGIEEGLPKDFLTAPALARLRSLVLSNNGRPKLDLAPLADMRDLRFLYVGDTSVGIGSIAAMPALEELTLYKVKGGSLDFVNRVATLRVLKLVLGSREHIREIDHPHLRVLEIVQVRDFARFDPAPLSALERLSIEDQVQLKSLDLGEVAPQLIQLQIRSCKNLKQLKGLRSLERLKELRLILTALDPDLLIQQSLPASLATFEMVTGKTKLDRELEAKLSASGYKSGY